MSSPTLQCHREAAAQPLGADPVEPHRVAAHRFVIAQGDPGVLHRVPLVPMPPRASVQGDHQQPHHAGEQPADVVHRRRRRKPSDAAVDRVRNLLAPVPARQLQQGGGCLAGAIDDDLAQPVHQHAQHRCRDLPAQLDDPKHAPGHFPAHQLRQTRQVHPGPPGPVVTERARIPRRDTRLGETPQLHRVGHRRPQTPQGLHIAATTGRLHPVRRGLLALTGHEPDPICS